MKKELPAYCYYRQGGRYIYYERRGEKGVRMISEPGTPQFAAEYARLMQGVQPLPKTRDFKSLVRSYFASDRYRKLSPRTAQDYDKILKWVVDTLGPLPVEGLQRKDVIRARDANAETVRFANYIVQILRILMEHAIDKGWRKEGTNPAKGVSLLKSEGKEREPWPDHLIAKYRATGAGRALLIFELCIGTGQRIGDVLKMRWADIEDGGIHIKQNKTKTRLWVPLTPHLKAVLDTTPRVGLTICAWGKNGKPTSYRGAADLVMAVRKLIGAEDYDIHSLRYTTAAELGEAGADDSLIQSVLGHQTVAMAAKYAGPSRQRARAQKAQSMRKPVSDVRT